MKPLAPALGTPLTRRHVQVIAGFARGHSSYEIGYRLGITWETVKDHRSRISLATGCGSRAEIVNYAYEHGYLTALPPENRAPIRLKPFELDVLGLMASDLEYAAIAAQLFKSRGAVKSCATRIFRKLGVRDRAHAVAIGWQQGLLGGVRQREAA